MSQIIKSEKPTFGPIADLLHVLRTRAMAMAIFVVVMVISIAGIEAMLSGDDRPNLGLFGKKVDYLREAHDRYNVLFVGTSSIYRAIDPVLLGDVAKRHGCDVRAFNLGVSKLRLTELRHIQENLSAEMVGDYDLIVLSPMAASGIKAANWPSSRIQHFSDWEGYKTSLVDLWEYPTTKRAPRIAYYSALLSGAFFYRQLGIGRLINTVEGWPGASTDNHTGDVFDGGAIMDFSRHGFVPLDDEPHEQFERRRDGMINNVAQFEALKTGGPEASFFDGPMAERAWRRYSRAMEHFAHLGVPTLMFMPPMVAYRAQDEALANYAASQGMPLVHLNQIDRYPEFFENRYWFDYYHTNKAGAALVTEMLGEKICSFMPNQGS